MSLNNFSNFDDKKLRKLKAGILSFMIIMLVICWVIPSVFSLDEGSTYVVSDDAGIQFTAQDVTGVIDDGDYPSASVEIIDDETGGTDVVDSKDFFVKYRMERDRVRADQMDMMREALNNANSTDAAKDAAQQQIADISKALEDELMLETLIRSKGVEDAIVFVDSSKVNVIVSSLEGEDCALSAEKVALLVSEQTGMGLDSVFVTVKN